MTYTIIDLYDYLMTHNHTEQAVFVERIINDEEFVKSLKRNIFDIFDDFEYLSDIILELQQEDGDMWQHVWDEADINDRVSGLFLY